MSMYAAAIMTSVDLMTGASADAAYEAAYGKAYNAYAKMHGAANAKVTAEANIAAIKQDKINTDTIISIQQDQAEAEAKVLAAVEGSGGQSHEAVVYQTEVNSSLAKANTAKKVEQGIENQLTNVHNAQATLLSIDPTTEAPDVLMAGLGASLKFMGSLTKTEKKGIGLGFDNMMKDLKGDSTSTSTGGMFLPTGGK